MLSSWSARSVSSAARRIRSEGSVMAFLHGWVTCVRTPAPRPGYGLRLTSKGLERQSGLVGPGSRLQRLQKDEGRDQKPFFVGLTGCDQAEQMRRERFASLHQFTVIAISQVLEDAHRAFDNSGCEDIFHEIGHVKQDGVAAVVPQSGRTAAAAHRAQAEDLSLRERAHAGGGGGRMVPTPRRLRSGEPGELGRGGAT